MSDSRKKLHADWLRYLMYCRRLNKQSDLAKIVGIDTSTISRMINEDWDGKPESYLRIATVAGVDHAGYLQGPPNGPA